MVTNKILTFQDHIKIQVPSVKKASGSRKEESNRKEKYHVGNREAFRKKDSIGGEAFRKQRDSSGRTASSRESENGGILAEERIQKLK